MKRAKRQFLVPEVMQSSLMDCGPAALKAVLDGFAIRVQYDVLRARCETDVDGTSMSALARLGGELGLRSREVLVSRDSFLLPESKCLPAIVVTRGGGGQLHFIVVWRVVGDWAQIMDPAAGRRWLRTRELEALLPEIPLPMSHERFRRWVGTETARAALRARLRAVGARGARAERWLSQTQTDETHHSFAALDAAVRMVTTLIENGALRRGRAAARLIGSLMPEPGVSAADVIPKYFWWAMDEPSTPGRLQVRGSVIVHFEPGAGPVAARADLSQPTAAAVAPESGGVLSAPAQRALQATTLRPDRVLWNVAWREASATSCWIIAAVLASAALVPIEALLLRGLLTVQRYLTLDYQRAGALVCVIALMLLALGLDFWAAAAVRRVGRVLEGRIRAALLEKLPRLDDAYLRTRPSADMAGRGHSLHVLREIPGLWVQMLRGVLGVVATAAGLFWLYPSGGPLIGLAVVLSVLVPFCARRSLSETSVRLRTHGSALDAFYLDALIGVTPIRVHGAETAVRRQHESLLTEWGRTARQLHTQSTSMQAVQLFCSTAIAVVLVATHLSAGGDASAALLLAYWALRLPSAAQELAAAQLALRNSRSTTLRLLAPLTAPTRDFAPPLAASADRAPVRKVLLKTLVGLGENIAKQNPKRGAEIVFDDISVRVGGHILLRDVRLALPAGSHVAIVGASGAGKSTLLSVLLGFLDPSAGRILLDGRACDSGALAGFRRDIAWIDPAVRIWDRSLYENLTYADDRDPQSRLHDVLAAADLFDVLEQLPAGMQTSLGEGGIRISGGQGQRVRIGRVLMQREARLVLLDEPFRGLPHAQRARHLQRIREHFRHATLLFVSHDVCDTAGFDRVLVIDSGRVAEDAAPRALLENPHSLYARLTATERDQRAHLWSGDHWQRRRIDGGLLTEGVST